MRRIIFMPNSFLEQRQPESNWIQPFKSAERNRLVVDSICRRHRNRRQFLFAAWSDDEFYAGWKVAATASSCVINVMASRRGRGETSKPAITVTICPAIHSKVKSFPGSCFPPIRRLGGGNTIIGRLCAYVRSPIIREQSEERGRGRSLGSLTSATCLFLPLLSRPPLLKRSVSKTSISFFLSGYPRRLRRFCPDKRTKSEMLDTRGWRLELDSIATERSKEGDRSASA